MEPCNLERTRAEVECDERNQRLSSMKLHWARTASCIERQECCVCTRRVVDEPERCFLCAVLGSGGGAGTNSKNAVRGQSRIRAAESERAVACTPFTRATRTTAAR